MAMPLSPPECDHDGQKVLAGENEKGAGAAVG
jgi:hypothetical protein